MVFFANHLGVRIGSCVVVFLFISIHQKIVESFNMNRILYRYSRQVGFKRKAAISSVHLIPTCRMATSKNGEIFLADDDDD